jgi:tRNA(fMet)-specific endonuclease VapC
VDPRYLLDTNICIYIRREKPERVLRHFDKVSPGETAISVITYGELLYGATKSSRREAALETVREFVRLVVPLPMPEKAGEVYGFIRANLEARGEMIGPNDLRVNDLWIAAHAVAAGLTLVTNNEKEFRRVRGLKVQNWAA